MQTTPGDKAKENAKPLPEPPGGKQKINIQEKKQGNEDIAPIVYFRRQSAKYTKQQSLYTNLPYKHFAVSIWPTEIVVPLKMYICKLKN